MKIVIDAIPLLSPLTGVGNYTFNLIREFQRLRPDFEYTFYYGYSSKRLKYYPRDNKIFYYTKELAKKIPLLSSHVRSIKNTLVFFHPYKYDLYFEPNFIPLEMKAKKTVATVYDFSFHHHPEWHPKERADDFSKNFFKRIKKADCIITISKYVEKEALEMLKIRDCRIVTIYPGFNDIFEANEYEEIGNGFSEKYILFVGSIEPRKNLVKLLKAYLSLPEYIKKNFKLLLVGFRGWENKEIIELLNKSKGAVNYLGYVKNEKLAELYRKASCFVYPSLYEGFGLPPLEAMACGCPVVVSNVSSLPEVCGDAAYYVDPTDTESIAGGIEKVLRDEELRQNMIEKGLERAKLFSWEKAAKEHLKVFEEVVKL
jgi:glycosyltransferase involved in cell wall biosynthesis